MKVLLGGCLCVGMRIQVYGGGGKNFFPNPENPFPACQDAMLVALKSLMPACLFNVIGFGSTFKTLFPSSQTYSEVRRSGRDQERVAGEEQREGRKRVRGHLEACLGSGPLIWNPDETQEQRTKERLSLVGSFLTSSDSPSFFKNKDYVGKTMGVHRRGGTEKGRGRLYPSPPIH